jgi:pimeloyl-ACP methyl ester carboxylesterase
MTQAPITHFVKAAGHEIHVAEWGRGNAETAILWHGLARTGADFEMLARELSREWRVLVPDAPGRGLSSWAQEEGGYGFAGYAAVAADVCALFGVNAMMWVGTSMGGALGIRLAAGPFAGRITHLVVNDIGPELPKPAVERILAYASNPPVVDTLEEIETFLRAAYRSFGQLSEAEWKRMTVTSARRLPDGRITLHYDPRMTRQFVNHPGDYDQWDAWRAVGCQTLILRGAESDLLLSDVAERMLDENPLSELVEIGGVGHAPALNVPEQIETVAAFLRRPNPGAMR